MFYKDSNQCPSEWLSIMLLPSYIINSNTTYLLMKTHVLQAQPALINSSARVPGRFDPAVTVIMLSPGGVWRFASPRLHLGIIASLLLVAIGSQHIVWLVYTVW